MKNTKIRFILCLLLVTFMIGIPVNAENKFFNIMMDGKRFYHTVYVYVNVKELKTPSMTTKSFRDLTTVEYLPLKAIATSMGDKFDQNGNKATVIKKNGTKIYMKVNSVKLTINGKETQYVTDMEDKLYDLNYYPIIKNNVFYVPIDNFGRNFGYKMSVSYRDGASTKTAENDFRWYFIGERPAVFSAKSKYPYVYLFDIQTKATNKEEELALVPVLDFFSCEKRSYN